MAYSTRSIVWRVVEILGGVILPIVCFVFDPVVFRGDSMGRGLLGAVAVFAYSAAAAAMVTFIVSLVVQRTSDLRAGILLAAAIVAGAIGIAIFPFALVSIHDEPIAWLGFVPFLTAFVYFRVARRTAVRFRSRRALAGAAVFILIPAAMQYAASHVVDVAVRALPHPAAMRTLAVVQSIKGLDDVVWTYSDEPDPAKKRVIAEAYRRLTGHDIEERLNQLLD